MDPLVLPLFGMMIVCLSIVAIVAVCSFVIDKRDAAMLAQQAIKALIDLFRR